MHTIFWGKSFNMTIDVHQVWSPPNMGVPFHHTSVFITFWWRKVDYLRGNLGLQAISFCQYIVHKQSLSMSTFFMYIYINLLHSIKLAGILTKILMEKWCSLYTGSLPLLQNNHGPTDHNHCPCWFPSDHHLPLRKRWVIPQWSQPIRYITNASLKEAEEPTTNNQQPRTLTRTSKNNNNKTKHPSHAQDHIYLPTLSQNLQCFRTFPSRWKVERGFFVAVVTWCYQLSGYLDLLHIKCLEEVSTKIFQLVVAWWFTLVEDLESSKSI